MPYWVYIVRCADGTLYTGIATDLDRRLGEHNGAGKGKGARYTRARRPVTQVYSAMYETRAQASKEEARIKSLSRSEKCALIATAAAQACPA